MALYLGGSEKLAINFKNSVIRLNIVLSSPITSGVKLLSFDNYLLKDSRGVYLTAKKEDK